MAKADAFRMPSLRTRLALAAGAGLLTTATLTALLLFVTWNSARVAAVATDAQIRVETFNHLLSAIRSYHSDSYRVVRENSQGALEAKRASQIRFEEMIEEASRLKVANLREREVRASITAQSLVVLDHFRDSAPQIHQVNTVWQDRGFSAALNEVSRVLAPVRRLEATIEQEIRRGDIKLGQAIRRARYLNDVAVVASIVCLLLAVLFLLVVLHLLHSRLGPGMTRLERGAKALGAGDLQHRIALEGNDELTVLANAFDSMAERIEVKQGELQDVQRGLRQAVEERTCELEEANRKLAEADERRRAFMADVGHELRTPLTIISGETQVALRMIDHPEFDAHEVLGHILDQTEHLGRMVNDMFVIARAEAGVLPLDRADQDLAGMVRRLASDFGNLVTESGGSIAVDTSGEVVAWVDQERLHRAMAALIDNALKHCPPGVSIRLVALARGDMAELSVIDDGPGIDPAVAERMFDRFARGQTSSKGSGLGLSLVSALAQSHGGKAFLRPNPGGGTQAGITIPRSEPGRIAA